MTRSSLHARGLSNESALWPLSEKERSLFFSHTSPDLPPACRLWKAHTSQGGYGRFHLRGRCLQAHRVSYLIAHGSIPVGYLILHRCHVRLCVNPDHLYAGLDAENMRDMDEAGRRPLGENRLGAKINEDIVRAIRMEHATGESYRATGRRHGIHGATVRQIVLRERWAHVS